MADAFYGEIRLVPFDFAPPGWLLCQGQTLAIPQFQALFALLGTVYGGDGRSTFKLPDLRGRAAIQAGAGLLGAYQFGEQGGTTPTPVQTTTAFTLTADQLPAHSHTATFTPTGGGAGAPPTVTLQVSNDPATSATPLANGYPAGVRVTGLGAAPMAFAATAAGKTALNPGAAVVSGGGDGITGGSVGIGATGQGKPVNMPLSFNVPAAQPPFLAMNYMICVSGIWPSRP